MYDDDRISMTKGFFFYFRRHWKEILRESIKKVKYRRYYHEDSTSHKNDILIFLHTICRVIVNFFKE